ncbi:hypothetical protein C163_16255 [Pseudomonas sp. FGI182]|nr:hypothetical protein C163_16255 [Pseudomonas sp. FGI182]
MHLQILTNLLMNRINISLISIQQFRSRNLTFLFSSIDNLVIFIE